MKNVLESNQKGHKEKTILAIRNSIGRLETRNKEKADILNEYFSSIGRTLAIERQDTANQNQARSNIGRITPTIMYINLNEENILRSIQKLRSNTACGPDQVSANLLKIAREAIVPSLLSIFKSSVTMSIVPDTWKKARICAIHKKEDETERTNYRPISLLCLPGRFLESSVCSSI